LAQLYHQELVEQLQHF